ncbi:hypothetical protein ACLI4Z_16610 (plasmid) [Natrialbaceae archaeon A-arb3/5]
MSTVKRPRNTVLELVEDETLTLEQAKAILPDDSKPSVERLLDDPTGSCNRIKAVALERSVVLDLVEDDSLSEAQASEILDVDEAAIAQTLD